MAWRGNGTVAVVVVVVLVGSRIRIIQHGAKVPIIPVARETLLDEIKVAVRNSNGLASLTEKAFQLKTNHLQPLTRCPMF